MIPAGQSWADVVVTPIQDNLAEGNETVTLLLADATTYNIGSPNTATVTIQDEPLPVVTLAVTDAIATEGGAPGVFTFTRTGSTANSLTVSVVVGGTAVPADYAAIATNVVFAAGSDTATITITAVDDRFKERDETVIVRLLPGAGYDVGNPFQGVVTIVGNDGNELPEVSFVFRNSTVSENVGTAQILVQISGDSSA